MKKLKIQDLIAVGIYTALYFLIISVCLLILRFIIPGFHNLFIPAVSAMFSGIIYFLLMQRVPKFGAITIMGTVISIFFLLTGHFPFTFLPGLIFSYLADIVQYKTKINEKVRTLSSYILFSYGLMGPIFPLWFMRNAYISSLEARGKGQDYIQRVFEHVTMNVFFVSMIAVFVGAIFGFFFGSYLFKKHFQRTKR